MHQYSRPMQKIVIFKQQKQNVFHTKDVTRKNVTLTDDGRFYHVSNVFTFVYFY